MEPISFKEPCKICINKARAKKDYRLYGMLSLLSLYGFWCGTCNFFGEDFFYPLLLILMLLCFILLVKETVKQYNLAKDSNAVIVLTEEGIEFLYRDYAGIGIIPWTEILGCREIGKPYFVAVFCINVKNPSYYLDRIGEKNRKRLQKFNAENDMQCVFKIETIILDVDIAALKKTIYKMVEKVNF